MLNQQSTIFPKQLKLDNYEAPTKDNLIRIMETSNLLLGNGGRSSSSSVVMCKCLHFLKDDGGVDLGGKTVLEFGSGVGLLGIYLAALGANVVLSDLPCIKDMAQRNINLNRQILKGEAQFMVLNWKKHNKSEQPQSQQGKSTSSSQLSTTTKWVQKFDWTIACQSGSLQDLQDQLKWIGKQGMICGFMDRNIESQDFLSSRQLEQYLMEVGYQYERIQSYHPDYVDERVAIYRIWK